MKGTEEKEIPQDETILVQEEKKENLGSDWKVLKNSWKRCKKGDINKWEFSKIGLSKIGKKFAGIFIKV